MSDVNDGKIIPPFSHAVRMNCQGAFCFPVVVFAVVCLYSNVVTLEDFLGVLTNPIAIVTILVVDFAWPHLMFNFFTSKIREYDGTDESARTTNKFVAIFQKVAIGSALLNIPIMIFLPTLIAKMHGMKLEVLSVMCAAVGSVLTMGLLPYIIFTQQMEANLFNCPFKKREIPMSFVTRNVVVAILSALGLMFFNVIPIFVSSNSNMTAYELFYAKIVPLSSFALLCMIADNVILHFGTHKKIAPITDFVANLSNRDYSHPALEITSRDEFGYLRENINDFYNATRGLLTSIMNSVVNTMKTSQTLSTSMTETSSAVTQITAHIESIRQRVANQAAGVEEAEGTIFSMENQINSLGTSVERQNSDIANSSSAVEEMVANVRSVTDILLKNSAAVKQLAAASDNGRIKVEEAVDQTRQMLEESAGLMEASEIIQNIAEQTNLLAMNAAIEAAHAGEAGKGFAVVSDEIRKLAEQSNSQGRTITAQLGNLQESITNITNATKEVQDQFKIIENLAETVKNQENVVERAMQEQTSGNSQVLDAIKNMQNSAHALGADSAEIQSGSKEVIARMSELSQMTEEINGAMLEITYGTESINDSIVEVNDATASMREDVNILTRDISKFKLQ